MFLYRICQDFIAQVPEHHVPDIERILIRDKLRFGVNRFHGLHQDFELLTIYQLSTSDTLLEIRSCPYLDPLPILSQIIPCQLFDMLIRIT